MGKITVLDIYGDTIFLTTNELLKQISFKNVHVEHAPGSQLPPLTVCISDNDVVTSVNIINECNHWWIHIC